MGIVSSKATATPEIGPQLTPSEKSAAKATSIEAWLKRLEDQDNSVRLNFIHLFALAVHDSIDMKTNCDYLEEHLLMTCINDRRRVEKVLQTPFLNGETLITWTICHLLDSLLSDESFDSIPSVLAVQLGFIPAWETNKSLTSAMSVACCTRNTNKLFQFLNPYRRSRNLKSIVYTLYNIGHNPKLFEFEIDSFSTHMEADKRIDLRFICESRLYSIGFLIGAKGQWSFFYDVVQDQSVTKKYTREVHVDLERSKGSEKFSVFKVKVSSSSWTSGEWIGGDASMLKNANEFVGRDRVLKGHIRIVDC